ncbi:MAG: hemin uptake protein HemP [Roseobacter sp.]|jgi:hemin uptake protein HemP|nr:hemin uptake protein HemP [Roseobacter sp.]
MEHPDTKTAVPLPYPTYDVREITDRDGRAALNLDGVIYTLRITQTGKLILTK